MKKSITFAFVFVSLSMFSQTFMHEVGIFLGPVSTQTDYGERGDFKSNTGNIGLSIGLTHTLSFYNGRSYLEENLRMRTEFSYASTKLKYYGAYVDPADTSVAANQLRAMKGKTQYANIGIQFELNAINIQKRHGDINFYGTIGGMYSMGTSTVSSTLGNINTSGILPAFLTDDVDEYRNDKFNTFAMTAGFGVNFDLGRNSRIFAEYRNQFFFSDWVDGLNAKNFEPNKKNDAAAQLSFGIAFYLGR
jgi:hypothetical protein